MAGSRKARAKRLSRWERPLKNLEKTGNSYHSANLSDPNFDFLFLKAPMMRCSFCRKNLDNELFFYKTGKAVTRRSVLAFGDVEINQENQLICRQCWHDKRLDVV